MNALGISIARDVDRRELVKQFMLALCSNAARAHIHATGHLRDAEFYADLFLAHYPFSPAAEAVARMQAAGSDPTDRLSGFLPPPAP